jgi:ketosteroid isomerase-like protein
MQAHDAAGEAAVYAGDGVEYRAHLEPIVGPRALEEWERKSFAENPKLNVDWSTETIQVAQSGELAIQTGQFHVTGFGALPDWEDKGRLVTVWKKVNGEWKVAHAMVSTTMSDPLEEKKQ